MINLRLPVNVKYVLSVSLTLPRSLKLSLSHSIVIHMVVRIYPVLPVFLLHPSAKIWQDFTTSSPSLILRELQLSFTKLYIFYKLKNVQSIVDGRNWTRVNYFQTTWPSRCRRRHRSWTSRIVYATIASKVAVNCQLRRVTRSVRTGIEWTGKIWTHSCSMIEMNVTVTIMLFTCWKQLSELLRVVPLAAARARRLAKSIANKIKR